MEDFTHAVDAGALIADRYRLGARLGAGSRGEVFAARDDVGGADVAIKLLHPASSDERRRVLREIAALRALKVPGVVPLRDEGRHGPRHFIVMDRVDGAPFPGAHAGDAEETFERVRRLLTILDRVHATGIVHRDLKPANVLVDDAGQVVVLDFGLARGTMLGATMTASGAAVGTPRYQAPEQMRGLVADARADLYAVGVMAFEALAGRPPHPADSLPMLMRARLMEPAPPLASLAPSVPPAVADLVDRLLARNPADRPATAAEALATTIEASPVSPWPWIGSRAPIDAAVARLERGESCTLGGPRRSGRSRCVCEIAEEIGAAGRAVMRLATGDRPFASLADVVDPSQLSGAGALPDRVERALQSQLDAGAVILADDGIDRWTVRVLDRLVGPVLRVVDPGSATDVVLDRVSVADLMPLFAGPERLFHLRSDGSAALLERAGGLRADLIDELGAWVRDGAARREADGIGIDRAALQRVLSRPRGAAGSVGAITGPLADVVAAAHLTWPNSTIDNLALALDRPAWEIELAVLELAEERAMVRHPDARWEPRAPASALPAWSESRLVGAHARMAAALPLGTPGRLNHLLAGSDVSAIADEACHRAEAALTDGRCADGIGLIQEALRAIRREVTGADGTSESEARLLMTMARLALLETGAHLISEVRAALTRVADDRRFAGVRALLAASVDLNGPSPSTARETVEALSPFEDPRLELIRLTIRATAAIYEGPDRAGQVLDEAAPWFATRSRSEQARFAGWRGNLLYRQGRFADAARLHLAAAADRAEPKGRLACLANAGLALLEAFDFDLTRETAERLARDAAERRLSFYEAIGQQILRAVDYRTGRAEAPDVELCTAAGHLHHVTLASAIALNEAAVAWRLGQYEQARQLAGLSATRARSSNQAIVVALAEGVELLAGGPEPAKRSEELAAFASSISLPRVAAQLLGIARRCHPSPPAAWHHEAVERVSSMPVELHHHRLEVLSLREAIATS